MNNRKLALAAILCTAALIAQSQIALPPFQDKNSNDFKISADVHNVLLDVSVKDTSGGFAGGLAKENFRILENSKPQEIASFASRDIPVTVGIVVDNSGSMHNKRADVVTAALTFVKESNPQDEVFIVNFNDTVKMGLPDGTDFSDDSKLLRTALLSNPVQGRTALYDGICTALTHLEKGRRDKKTLVVISDGGDNMSEHTLDDVLRLAQEETATIYTIGIYDADEKQKNPGVLKRIAHITGGEYIFPEKPSETVDACRRIAKDIRNRYTLSYIPQNMAFDGKMRKIQVLAQSPDRGKLVVRTRTSYIPRPRTLSAKQPKQPAQNVKPEVPPATSSGTEAVTTEAPANHTEPPASQPAAPAETSPAAPVPQTAPTPEPPAAQPTPEAPAPATPPAPTPQP